MMLLADILTSLIQAIIFSYSTEFYLRNKENINKYKFIMLAAIIFIINIVFTSTVGNISLCVFIVHALSLLPVLFFYKYYGIKTIIPYTVIYCIMSVYNIISYNLFFGFFKKMVPAQYTEILKLFVIYVPYILFIYLFIKFRNELVKLCDFIIIEKINAFILILVSFCIDFVLAFYLIIYNDESKLFKNIIITVLCIFLILIMKYFAKIKAKSNEILQLNEALQLKNKELGKIKHDYGAQISYLYGLCLMERYDDLKQSIKDIINKNESTQTSAEITENKDTILSLALKPALESGIHVIVRANTDINNALMPEMELYRVLFNIVNNAVRAMGGQGIIIARCYKQINDIIIKLENNGPKIEKEVIDKIFEAGFTTKSDKDNNHGFGLTIVKELIENYQGKISVKSSNISTEFKIILPCKNTY